MKGFITGAVVATLVLTTSALAFGPGLGRGQGWWGNGQSAQTRSQIQTNTPNARAMWAQRMGQNQARPMGQGINRGNRTGEPVFMDSWDEDESGIVTLTEAKAHRADLFDSLDENEDGVVVAAEFAEFLNNQRMPPEEATNGQRGLYGMTLSFNDANSDGSVTKDEFLGQTQAWLVAMDRNGDGKISDDDFGQRRGQMGRGTGRGQGFGRFQPQS